MQSRVTCTDECSEVVSGREGTAAAAVRPPAQARGAIAASLVTPGFLAGVARGAVGVLALQVAGAGMTYGSQVAFARWLGIRQFGTYSYVIAWAVLLGLLVGLGFPQSVLRFVPQYRARNDLGRLRGLYRSVRAATLVVSGTVAVGAALVALAILHRRLGRETAVLAAGAVLLPLGAMVNLDSALARAQGAVFRAFAPSLVLRPALVMAGGAVILAVRGSLSALDAVVATIVAMSAVAVLQAAAARRSLRSVIAGVEAVYEWRTWLRVSLPLLLVSGFLIALTQTDLLVVGALRGLSAAAVYSAASKTSTLIGYVLLAVSAITAPIFAELYERGDIEGLQRLTAVAAQWVFWPTIAIAVVIGAASPVVLGLFGPAYVAGRWVLLLLLGGQVVNASCGAVGYLLSMTGHQDDLARVYGVVAVVNIGLCSVGALYGGVAGAAAGSAVSMVVWNLWLYELTKRRIHIRASIWASFSVLRLGPVARDSRSRRSRPRRGQGDAR